MKILVTGANGFLGEQLCIKLNQQGYSVRGAVRANSQFMHAPNLFIVGAIDVDTKWAQALMGVDAVVHAAARVHVMKDKAIDPLAEFRRVNVDGTLNLARQAAKAGVKRFVFISSIGVNGWKTDAGKPFSEHCDVAPQNAYAQSKWEAEEGLQKIATETGLEVVIIRPPLIYGANAPGNFGSLMRAVRLGIPLPLGAVYNQRSLVGLDNLCDFITTCLSHPNAANEIFLVSDGQDLSTTELLRSMAKGAGLSSRLLPVPMSILQLGANIIGKADAVQRICGNLQVNISKARTLLNWMPPISVTDGLKIAATCIKKGN